jgi:hypothetical protein
MSDQFSDFLAQIAYVNCRFGACVTHHGFGNLWHKNKERTF